MPEPIISVVMPVYNTEKYLKESVESILNQTFTDFEFIIVDDYSTDSSWQIIQEYANKDPRIVAVKNTGEKGCWSVRNFGWDLAKRKYMSLMDSDDIALPEMLQKQFDFMEQNPDIDVCGGWIKNFGTNEQAPRFPLTHEDIKDTLFFYCCMAQPTVIMRLSSLNKLNVRYAKYIAEDYELWTRLVHQVKFANLPEILLFRRMHANQITTAERSGQNNNANWIRIRNIQNINIELSKEYKCKYLDIVEGNVVQKNTYELVSVIKMLNMISTNGAKSGYGQYFQDIIKNFIKNIIEHSLQNNVTSLKLYFTTFRKWKIFETPRANLRYIYHSLRNLLHV